MGLREAAANLRICPTTLKRACRRHGITRWPRRQLAKLNRSEASKSDVSTEQQQNVKMDWSEAPSNASGVSGRQLPASNACAGGFRMALCFPIGHAFCKHTLYLC